MVLFTIVGLGLVILCFVSLLVNTSLMYFITQFYQLRNMSVAGELFDIPLIKLMNIVGLVALSAANDIMLSLLATLLLPSLLAFEWMWKITERTCEVYLVGRFIIKNGILHQVNSLLQQLAKCHYWLSPLIVYGQECILCHIKQGIILNLQ